jgi:hypothetical protein
VKRSRTNLIVAVACVTAFLLINAAVASANVVWRLDSLSNSTVAPGGTLDYNLQVTNIGTTATDGGVTPITLTVNLPTGLSFVGQSSPPPSGNQDWSCGGTTTVVCTNNDVFEPFGSGFDYSTPIITVAVDGGLSGPVTTTFQVSGGDPAAVPATTADSTTVTAVAPVFGIDAFDGQITADAARDPFTQAGGHPYAASVSIDFTTETNANPVVGEAHPVEPAKDVLVDLPPGLVGNPTVAAQCTSAELANASGTDAEPLCAPDSQIGTALVRSDNALGRPTFGPIPVFNMVPPPGVPARFGFNVAGSVVTLNAELRSGSDYGLSVNVRNIPEGLALAGSTITFWGVPSDSSHDAERACPGQKNPWDGGPSCTSGAPRKAFLRNPTSCTPDGVGLPTTAHVDSWFHPGAFLDATFISHLPPAYPFPSDQWGSPQGTSGCDRVPFDPVLTDTPVAGSKVGAPAGFVFDLTLPQSDDPDSVGEGDLKTAVVTLPAGVHVSPSSANGLGACSPAQVGLHSTDDPTCPDSSKLGTMRIDTPLLDQPLTGSIYLATPHDNPFDSLLAIYLVAKGPGLIVKLPGHIVADAHTGQLTATFDNNPQLPFSTLHLVFDGGPHAALVAPSTCGGYETDARLTSWSGKTVLSKSSFTMTGDAEHPCQQHFSPAFLAQSQNPVAGADSSFLVALSREDADRLLGSLVVDMPQGMTGRIASAVLCPNGPANAGTCTAGSKVGSVTVGAGAGPDPFFITDGRAYITGPYKGAPFGLSIVVPAVAGPFDLGDVVVRAAVFVDRHSAQLRVVSDPFPTIRQGIPLDLRDVRVNIDRPHFIVNPTSCAEKHVFGTITSTDGAVAHGLTRFQVGECGNLALAPKMSLTVGARHRTRAGVSTPFTATLTQTPGQANLRSVTVTLPTTLNALLPVLNRACTLAQFESGHCSRSARAGSAVAVTPLLRDPLRGSAFFVRNPHRILPDLVVALRGQVAIDLTGKVGVKPRTNQLTTRFDTIPDVAITKFALRLVAGANGPLGTTANLCSAKARRATASIAFRGQNGKTLNVRQRLRIRGCPRRR